MIPKSHIFKHGKSPFPQNLWKWFAANSFPLSVAILCGFGDDAYPAQIQSVGIETGVNPV